ncbi:MAG TPA: GDP-mannose 4,6-dehydratase, partial [candidate division Zixibacteria bacterium]|nr:GDP-mannose 4,6-dehydratase [candidate division Zixibacteria bacterium]
MGKTQNQFKRKIAVTGGAGFIGSNLLLMMAPKYSDYLFVNIDCLTYAGNLLNLESISDLSNYKFEKVDITDFPALEKCFAENQFDSVIHLAAESHVDRSIVGPAKFIRTNIAGTFYLLELARKISENNKSFRFLHVSTDEVFGSAKPGEQFTEDSPFRPNSPYAASKAAAEHLVRSYFQTYGLDLVITNCTNNFGPYQFPEKLIPLVINNALNNKQIPVYGDGRHER